MAWYWIVLIVVGYILAWLTTSVLVARKENSKDFEFVILGFFWPLLILSLPIYGLGELCHALIKTFVKTDGKQ